MDAKDLTLFLTIARSGSLTDAAAKLYISQPALSKRLRSLEKEVGVSLIARGKGVQQISLTPAGRALIPLAEKMCDLQAEIETVCFMEHNERFLIDSIGSVGQCVLQDSVFAYSAANPELQMELLRDHGEACYDCISDGSTDLGFVTDAKYAPGIDARPAWRESMVLLDAAETGADAAETPRTERLDAAKEIAVPWNMDFVHWHGHWFSAAKRPRIALTAPEYGIPFLLKEHCWMIAPVTVAEHFRKNRPGLRWRRLTEAPPERIVYTIRRNGAENQHEQPFLHQVHEALQHSADIRSFLE